MHSTFVVQVENIIEVRSGVQFELLADLTDVLRRHPVVNDMYVQVESYK